MLPVALLFIILIALLFTSLGVAIASIIEDMQGFQLIMNFMVMPIFFLSGALFPLQGLPTALEVVTRIDPLTYGVDGIRSALGGVGSFGIGMDMMVIVIVAVIFLGVGTYLFERIQA